LWATANAFWADAAFWALIGGIITALLAALFGFIDFFGERSVRVISDAWQHMIGNLIAVVLAVLSVYVRYRSGHTAGVFPWGITSSFAVVLVLLFTGWKGGELTFRHRVGVIDTPPR
jgi:uncharacterized membrane protein